jgi:hypothetical protein
MYSPRLLLLSLLISLCFATAAAQSSPSSNSDSSHSATALPRNPEASTGPFQFQLPFLADGQSLSDDEGTISGNDSDVIRTMDIRTLDSRLDSHAQHLLTLQQDEKTCFTIRAYRVVRESPDSDTTRPAGYSTCVPTARVQLKQAVDTRVVVPR